MISRACLHVWMRDKVVAMKENECWKVALYKGITVRLQHIQSTVSSWINISQSIGSAALNLVVVWFTGQQTLAYMSHWLKVTFAGSIFPVAPILSRSQAHSSIQLVFPCNLVHCRLRSTLSMVNPFLCPFTCSLAIGQTRAAFFYHLHVCLKLKPYPVTTLDNSSHWCIYF